MFFHKWKQHPLLVCTLIHTILFGLYTNQRSDKFDKRTMYLLILQIKEKRSSALCNAAIPKYRQFKMSKLLAKDYSRGHKEAKSKLRLHSSFIIICQGSHTPFWEWGSAWAWASLNFATCISTPLQEQMNHFIVQITFFNRVGNAHSGRSRG